MLSSKPPITAKELNREGTHVVMNVITDKALNYVGAHVLHKLPTHNEWQRAHWVKKLNRGNVFIYMLGKGDEITDAFARKLAASWLDREAPWAEIDLARGTLTRYPVLTDNPETDPALEWLRELAKDVVK